MEPTNIASSAASYAKSVYSEYIHFLFILEDNFLVFIYGPVDHFSKCILSKKKEVRLSCDLDYFVQWCVLMHIINSYQ